MVLCFHTVYNYNPVDIILIALNLIKSNAVKPLLLGVTFVLCSYVTQSSYSSYLKRGRSLSEGFEQAHDTNIFYEI